MLLEKQKYLLEFKCVWVQVQGSSVAAVGRKHFLKTGALTDTIGVRTHFVHRNSYNHLCTQRDKP